MPPLISIVVPFYERSSFLEDVVSSVRTQTFQQWELMIVDDGSTEPLEEMIKPFLADNRIKYFRQANGGVSSARNAGVDRAGGEYIFFLDSDDKIHADTLQQFASVINKTRPDIIFCSCRMVKDGVPKIKHPYDHGRAFKNIRALFLAGAFCVRKNIFIKAGGYSTALKFSENYELGLRISQLNVKAETIDHIGVDYFIDTSIRVSNSVRNKLEGNRYLLENHFDIIKSDPDLLATTLSQTGYFLRAQGKKAEARAMYWRSFKVKPVNLRNLYRFLRSFY